MDILDSALSREIDAIKENVNAQSQYFWRAEFHANGKTISAMKLLSIDLIRDYEKKFADEIIVQVVVGAGQYAYRIHPFLKNLEMTLYREGLVDDLDKTDDGIPTQSERYTATLIDPIAINATANSINEPEESALDITNLLTLNVQLVNKAVEQIRMKTVGGVYRGTTAEEVVKYVMTTSSDQLDVDVNNLPQGVDMVPSSNKKKYDHILIPHGTRLINVPDYVHYKCGGLYTTGIGVFYQDRYWHIFGPYDNSRFSESKKTLTIIRVPENRFPGMERTFRKDGNNLVILATGKSTVLDGSESQMLSQGNGVRFADADQMMQTPVETGDNKALISRGSLNNEFITTNRANGNNMVPTSSSRITANPWVEYSKLAVRDGVTMGLTWENSVPLFLTPGMQVKLIWLEGREIKETFGSLIKAHHYTQVRGSGMTASRHVTTSALSVFCKRNVT